MGQLKLPEGKRIAVNLGVDFDAQSLWLGAFNMPTPAMMARGEFGAKVGVPRILELFERFGIKSTFFIPGHTVDTFTDACRQVAEHGHELGHHGYYHENPTMIDAETERRLMEMALASFDQQLGVRPRGYRSPYWDYSESTLDLVEELGFSYDSSLMARDLVPYRPQRWQVNWERASVAGPASRVLEIPVNWYLDDFPVFAYVGGVQTGQQDTDTFLRRWRDIFDYGYERVEGACFASTVHPQIIGQAHHMLAFERLIEHIASKDDVWFAPLAEIAEAWEDDDEDRRLMELPDVRGVEAPPASSGWT
jgi:peptidoglycan-N-acetylglucosamine deacetylase